MSKKLGFKQFASSANPLSYKPPPKRKYLNHGFYVGQRVYYVEDWGARRTMYGIVQDKEGNTPNEKYPVWCLWDKCTCPSYMPKHRIYAAEDSK